MPTVAPKNSTPLPPVKAAADAPTQINDVTTTGPAENTAVQNTATGKKKKKKNPKPKFKGSEESSSKHKRKKGLKKLNPF
jgi:outer membrane protein assembly factor BamD